MAGPTVEELLGAGGKRRAPPQVGAGETLVNRAVSWVPGANRLVDALSAGALELGSSGGTRATLTPEAEAELRSMGEEVPTPEGLLERYRQVRERRRERTDLGSEQNPWAARAGDVLGLGLSALAPLPKFAGKGLRPTLKTGAAYGAIHGATEGAGDLTRGEVGQAAWETLKGGALGAGAGAFGHGLIRLGQRGAQALRGARSEVLAQETAAAREGAEQAQAALAKEVGAHRDVVGQARGMMARDFAKREAAAAEEAAALERQHGQALEIEKGRSARAGRAAQRASERERDVVGQAMELNKRFDAKKAADLDRQIAQLERAADAERKMVGQALEMNKARDIKERGMVGQAREMNKALDRQERQMIGQAREMDKRIEKARNLLARARYRAGEGPQPDPSTKVLRGFRGKAGERWAAEDPRLQRYAQELQDPNLPPARRERIQQYVDEHRLAFEDPAAFERSFMERYIRERYQPEQAERILQRIGPKGEILPRGPTQQVGPPQGSSPLPAGLPEARIPAPSAQADELTQRADLFDAARRGEARAGGGGSAWADYDPSGRTIRALPEDLPGSSPPIQRGLPSPLAARPAPVPGTDTAPLRPRPTPTQAPPLDAPIELTRLAGPGDVGAIAAERAAAREAGALGAIGRAGMEGLRSSGNVIGAVLGGAAGLSRELLRDPAVRARALAAARLHMLQRINPQLFAQVGGTLAAAAARGESEYRAARLLELRRNPALRLAEQQAAREAERLSDEELIQLFSGAPAQP